MSVGSDEQAVQACWSQVLQTKDFCIGDFCIRDVQLTRLCALCRQLSKSIRWQSTFSAAQVLLSFCLVWRLGAIGQSSSSIAQSCVLSQSCSKHLRAADPISFSCMQLYFGSLHFGWHMFVTVFTDTQSCWFCIFDSCRCMPSLSTEAFAILSAAQSCYLQLTELLNTLSLARADLLDFGARLSKLLCLQVWFWLTAQTWWCALATHGSSSSHWCLHWGYALGHHVWQASQQLPLQHLSWVSINIPHSQSLLLLHISLAHLLLLLCRLDFIKC